GRGQMENVIKQQQLDLKTDRTSTAHLESNQLRLWFSTLGYFLLDRLPAWGLAESSWAKATVGTVRLKLLKIAAQVTVSVRRIYVQMCSAYPLQKLWRDCRNRLQALSSEPIG
ncbi:MAG TPA: IS1380 family transposase, partial [Verrucomicrobiales bacterium]|nr:IS1380 family transposase [Verrucomicrobiales bacterium]